MDELGISLLPELEKQVSEAQKHGKTVSYASVEKESVGFVVISDKIKPTSKEAIRQLQEAGLQDLH